MDHEFSNQLNCVTFVVHKRVKAEKLSTQKKKALPWNSIEFSRMLWNTRELEKWERGVIRRDGVRKPPEYLRVVTVTSE
jgi:hypothetical protein